METSREFEHIGDIFSRMDRTPTTPDLPDPPFDSPIERAFAETCFEFLSPTVQVMKQAEISTTHGTFRLDFLMSINGRRIAIECDGKEFHERLRDELRDAILLGEGCCETVYHFRGCDLTHYPYDCIWLMSVLDADLFSQRGHLHLDRLRTLTLDVGKKEAETNESFMFFIEPPTRFMWVFRRGVSLASKNTSLNYHWKTLYKFACQYPHASLDELFDIRTC